MKRRNSLIENKEGDSSPSLRSGSEWLLFCHPEALAEGSPEGILPLRFAQSQNDRKEGILRLLTQPQNDNKGIRRCHERSEGMTPFLSSLLCHPFFTCHPEAKPKGLLRGFFPFASLRVRMTERRGFFGCWRNLRMTIKESDAVMNEAKEWPLFCHPFFVTPFFTCHPEAKPKGLLRGFFGRLRSLRMTEKNAQTLSWGEVKEW